MTDELENYKIRLAQSDAVIEHLKQCLIAEYAAQYRSDGEKGIAALEMAKEDAEREVTTAMNKFTEVNARR
jgi:hydroxypyruvate isomerase